MICSWLGHDEEKRERCRIALGTYTKRQQRMSWNPHDFYERRLGLGDRYPSIDSDKKDYTATSLRSSISKLQDWWAARDLPLLVFMKSW
ncbi:hypothetical protein TNCV_1021711 [Trichonephila clavipes]|uniref:Uncharacterized protein n=1 Tax=Trichonephila clavipes TaxID=2585209 RepID=A0A8X6SU10_TRICX|nr:hypothetical protein TNCV_1021711 [Trichonephila clavipes]